MENSATIGVVAVNAKWREQSHEMITKDKSRKHWFTRRFGQLKLFIGSVVFFTLTSFLCGFAHSMTELIIFRALQGFFAGPMFPMCQTLLLVIFPPMKRSMALALLSMVTVVAPIV